MSPEFFISPGFFVILFVTVALLTVFVLWLLHEPAIARRGGMVDLTGGKPTRAVVWDWPVAPTVEAVSATITVSMPATFNENADSLGLLVDHSRRLQAVEPEREPERRPAFQVFGPPHDPTANQATPAEMDWLYDHSGIERIPFGGV